MLLAPLSTWCGGRKPKPAGYAPVWGRSQAVCLPAEDVQEPSAPAARTVESDDLRSSSTWWLGPGGLQLVIVIAPNTHLWSCKARLGVVTWGLPLLTDEPGVHRGPVLTATLLGIIMDETLDASLDRIAAVRAIEPEQVRRRPGGDEIFDWCRRQQEGAPVQAAGSVALEGQVYLACGVQWRGRPANLQMEAVGRKVFFRGRTPSASDTKEAMVHDRKFCRACWSCTASFGHPVARAPHELLDPCMGRVTPLFDAFCRILQGCDSTLPALCRRDI